MGEPGEKLDRLRLDLDGLAVFEQLGIHREGTESDRPAERSRIYLELAHGSNNPMGCTLGEPGGNKPPVVYLSRDSIERHASGFGTVSSTETELARALGRVLAHELSHGFLRPGHTRGGILRRQYTHRDLIDEEPNDLQFTEEQTALLRARASGF